MHKIEIITLHKVKNYGSVLQTYATQKIFEGKDLDVEIIDFRRRWETKLGYWFYLPHISPMNIFRLFLYFPSKIIQMSRFDSFLKKHIRLTRHSYKNSRDFNKYPIIADIYCTGSDQVWNSGWNQGVIEPYFLNFVQDEHARKISYAASMGNGCIYAGEERIIRAYLNKYDYITVREISTKGMLRDVLHKPVKNVLDPTLQLPRSEWETIISEERIISESYILIIQLNRSSSFDAFVKKFSDEKKMKVVRLCLRVDQILSIGNPVVIPAAEDYLRLIRDSSYVLTDSFHAISFCLNFEKQFYCMLPNDYSERLCSILELTGLNGRIVSGDDQSWNESLIDYSVVTEIINEERKRCDEIINEMIKV